MRQASVKRAFRSVSGVGAVLAAALGVGEIACRTVGTGAVDGPGVDPADGGTALDAFVAEAAPADAAPSSYVPCLDPKPVQVGGQDTGFVRCASGALHRPNVLDCPLVLRDPDAGARCARPGAACTQDSDCTAKSLGRCDAPGCVCSYGCVRDSECASAEVCECGDGGGSCVPADCAIDSMCDPGSLCASVVYDQSCPAVSTNRHVYRCQAPGDACLGEHDCDGGSIERCIVGDAGPRVCKDFSILCVPPGRPFLIDGVARVAPLASSREWFAEGFTPMVSDLSPAAREAVAAYYNRAGQMEHASIAAFARFALELLALGAPASLLVGTHEAMADETEHAKMTFALASAYGGRPSGPGRLAMDGALGACTPERVFATLVREGCIGETLAAVEATEALARATDHAVKAVLERIAVDEARHAALSWRAARWLLAQGDDRFRTWAGAELTRALAERRASPVDAGTSDHALEAHGVLDAGTLGQLARAALDDVLEPLARAMLEPPRLSDVPRAA